MTIFFQTRSDAAAELDGTVDWEWGGKATWDGWVDFAYQNQNKFVETRRKRGTFMASDDCRFDQDQALHAYLLASDENPSDYSV